MNKVLLAIIIIQVLGFSILFSQTVPDSLWCETYGGDLTDFAKSLIQTNDGNYVFAGSTNSFGNEFYDVYLLKTDENGNELWSKTFGGLNHDVANSVIETSDNGLLITGYTYSFDSELSAIYVIKTDVNGDSLWTKVIDNYSYEFGNYGIQTSDENYVIVGDGRPENSDYTNIILLKIDENSNILWLNYYEGNNSYSTNSGRCVQQTNDNELIISGTTTSSEQINANAYLIKTDAAGDTLWTKQFNGDGNSCGNFIQQTVNGDIIIVGNVEYDENYSDIYLIRTNANGNTIWTSKFGSQFDYKGYCVKQTNNGEIILVGSIHDWSDDRLNAYILKANSNGDSLWSQSYGGDLRTVANSIISTREDEYLLAGSINSYSSPFQTDAFLLKLGNETIAENNINSPHFSSINYPNPFNPSTTISFSVTQNSDFVTLEIYNIKGQKIKTLIHNEFAKGTHSIIWSGDDEFNKPVSSGVYLYRLNVNGKTEAIKKCLLLK